MISQRTSRRPSPVELAVCHYRRMSALHREAGARHSAIRNLIAATVDRVIPPIEGTVMLYGGPDNPHVPGLGIINLGAREALNVELSGLTGRTPIWEHWCDTGRNAHAALFAVARSPAATKADMALKMQVAIEALAGRDFWVDEEIGEFLAEALAAERAVSAA